MTLLLRRSIKPWSLAYTMSLWLQVNATWSLSGWAAIKLIRVYTKNKVKYFSFLIGENYFPIFELNSKTLACSYMNFEFDALECIYGVNMRSLCFWENVLVNFYRPPPEMIVVLLWWVNLKSMHLIWNACGSTTPCDHGHMIFEVRDWYWVAKCVRYIIVIHVFFNLW